VQQREPLGPEFNDEAVDARKVASRSIETSNKPKRYGIGADEEHNWDAGARRLSRESRKHARCDDHSHSKLDQISRQRWQSISLVSRPAIFNHYVAAFNVAGFVQAPPETGQSGGVGLRRPRV